MVEDVTIEKIINTRKSTYKWKSPGIDKRNKFRFYDLPFMLKVMTKLISEIIKEHDRMPD